MAISKLYRQREELKQLVQASSYDEKEKKELLELVPHMKPSQLLRLKTSLMRLMMIDASEETIDETMKSKHVPENEEVLQDKAFSKFADKFNEAQKQAKQKVGE